MKKLIIFILLSISLNAQTWNNIAWLFQVPSGSQISTCADQNGVHIIYYTNNWLAYGKTSSDGTVQLSDISIDSGSDLGYAKINSIGGNLFVTYYKSGKIRIAKSTDSGSTWIVDYSTYNEKNTGFNALDTYVEGWNIHLAWSERRIGDPNKYDTHYAKFESNVPRWLDYKKVTDIETEGGDKPSIVVSNDRVHVTYSQYYEIHNRDKIISTGQWQSVENVPYDNQAFVAYVPSINTYYDNNYLHVVYVYVHSNWETTAYVSQAYRSVSGGNWTEDNNSFLTAPSTDKIVSTQTADNKVHVFYHDQTDNKNYHKTISGTTWTTVEEFNNTFDDISSSGNDIFRFEYRTVDNAILYQQYDANPTKPQNLVATFTSSNPVLTWSANPEPDIQSYKIYKMVVGETGWLNVATVSSTTTQWTDTDVTQPGRFDPVYEIDYKIKAVDLSNNLSPYSDVKKVTGTTDVIWKENLSGTEAEGIETYELFSNYPNPFNPATQITYQIPKTGFVNLVVYNSLGELVSTLVNERKEQGRYTVEFNATNLPSGMYVYQLTSGKYRASGKMLLMK